VNSRKGGVKMAKYQKKPVVIEAIQWNGSNIVETYNFLENKSVTLNSEVQVSGKNFYIKFDNGTCQLGSLIIKTLEGDMKAEVGDYIIRGVKGELYPCKPDIFDLTYEKVK
jgi:hypothetical protein